MLTRERGWIRGLTVGPFKVVGGVLRAGDVPGLLVLGPVFMPGAEVLTPMPGGGLVSADLVVDDDVLLLLLLLLLLEVEVEPDRKRREKKRGSSSA